MPLAIDIDASHKNPRQSEQGVLSILSREHRTAIACAEVLENALDYGGDANNRAKMIEIVADQLFAAPDDSHHFFERRLYRLLWSRLNRFLPRYFDLDAMHAVRRRRREELAPYLEIGRAALIKDMKARDAVRNFCDCVRSHIASEERQLFPLFRRHLTDEDWAIADEEFQTFRPSDFAPNSHAPLRSSH